MAASMLAAMASRRRYQSPIGLVFDIQLARFIIIREQLGVPRPTDSDIQLRFSQVAEIILQFIEEKLPRHALVVVAPQDFVDPGDDRQA